MSAAVNWCQAGLPLHELLGANETQPSWLTNASVKLRRLQNTACQHQHPNCKTWPHHNQAAALNDKRFATNIPMLPDGEWFQFTSMSVRTPATLSHLKHQW